MLRILLKTICHNEDLQLHDESFHTLDIENQELEKILLRGGCGNGGYEMTRVIGIEVIKLIDNNSSTGGRG